MNWKEKAEELLRFVEYSAKNTDGKYSHFDAMIEFAKLACEEQKKICSQYAEIHYELVTDCADAPFVDTNSILNAPTVKFDRYEK